VRRLQLASNTLNFNFTGYRLNLITPGAGEAKQSHD
jgi:hypothetical protein